MTEVEFLKQEIERLNGELEKANLAALSGFVFFINQLSNHTELGEWLFYCHYMFPEKGLLEKPVEEWPTHVLSEFDELRSAVYEITADQKTLTLREIMEHIQSFVLVDNKRKMDG